MKTLRQIREQDYFYKETGNKISLHCSELTEQIQVETANEISRLVQEKREEGCGDLREILAGISLMVGGR
jgi:hypothetical protein